MRGVCANRDRRKNFNSRPSARGDELGVDYKISKAEFQFTPLREGRPAKRQEKPIDGQIFQFTPLREGRPPSRTAVIAPKHFNSRPSARGDEMKRCKGGTVSTISIHAPPRGATRQSQATHTGGYTFQFTPLREGRRKAAQNRAYGAQFQFTPLREGRRRALSPCLSSWIFQFTPLREGRRTRQECRPCARLFQFTPLREGRPTM